MNSSDSAEEFVKIYLDGIDHAIRVTGVGAKNVGAMLIALSKDKKQTKGKTRLTNMIKTGKSVQIFTIEAKDLKKFSQEAKRYGILYCALAKKKNSKIDGMVDIMVRDEDSPKINRIAERFNFRSVASVKKDLELEKQAKGATIKIQEKTKDEQFIDNIIPVEKEYEKMPSNDTKDTEKKNQLEHSSNTKLKNKVESSKKEKKSVRKELKDIEEEIKAKEIALEKQDEKQEIQIDTSKINKKDKKQKHFKEEKEIKKDKHFKEPRHFDYIKKKKRKRKTERSM